LPRAEIDAAFMRQRSITRDPLPPYCSMARRQGAGRLSPALQRPEAEGLPVSACFHAAAAARLSGAAGRLSLPDVVAFIAHLPRFTREATLLIRPSTTPRCFCCSFHVCASGEVSGASTPAVTALLTETSTQQRVRRLRRATTARDDGRRAASATLRCPPCYRVTITEPSLPSSPRPSDRCAMPPCHDAAFIAQPPLAHASAR